MALRCTTCIAMGSFVYYNRAMTEERHLMADPEYAAYAEYMKTHGMFAPVQRYAPRVH